MRGWRGVGKRGEGEEERQETMPGLQLKVCPVWLKINDKIKQLKVTALADRFLGNYALF